MSAVAAAVIGSAVIGGAVSMSAASKAGKAQVQAADRSAEEHMCLLVLQLCKHRWRH